MSDASQPTLQLSTRVRIAFANALKEARQAEGQELDYARIIAILTEKAATLTRPLVDGLAEADVIVRLAVLKSATPSPKRQGPQKNGAIEIGLFYPEVEEPVVQFSFSYHATPLQGSLTLSRMSDVDLPSWVQAELDLAQLPAWVYDITTASFRPSSVVIDRFYTKLLYRAGQIIAKDLARREAAAIRQQENL